jgi:hypothetical protein
MKIPAYQMHKVMRVYAKQLSRRKMLDRQNNRGDTSFSDQISISAKGKRKAVIDKVTKDIVNRITGFGPKDTVDHEIANKPQEKIGEKIAFGQEQKPRFVFNIIDEKNEKATTSLTVEASGFLIEHLELLTKKMVDKNMGS